mmetsp:Transcript_22960/g.47725  ORF Transcript_22960/g.47725 Transcript_22960/m.47725 type:complete len:301 (+) Transcript_22960:125-1027(+)
MSSTTQPKISRKRKRPPPGEITPNKFASCLEQLNIFPYIPPSRSSPSCPNNRGSGNQTNSASPSVSQYASASGNPDTIIDESSTLFPRVECTNGAMEALRQIHSAFLSFTANYLAMESSLSSSALSSTPSIKRAEKGMKASTTTTKLINEKDVYRVMKEEMGFGDLVDRAMNSIESFVDRARESEEGMGENTKKEKGGGEEKKQYNNRSNTAANNNDGSTKAKRRMQQRKKSMFKKGLRDETTSEEMLAEQERLLEESARRMREWMMLNESKGGKGTVEQCDGHNDDDGGDGGGENYEVK